MSVKTVTTLPVANYSIQNTQDTVFKDPDLEETHKVHQIFKKNLQDLAKCLNKVDKTLKEIGEIYGVASETETVPQVAHVHKYKRLDIPAIKIHGNIIGIDIHLIRAEQFTSEFMTDLRQSQEDPLSKVISDSESSDDERSEHVSETDISGTFALNSS